MTYWYTYLRGWKIVLRGKSTSVCIHSVQKSYKFLKTLVYCLNLHICIKKYLEKKENV